LKIKEAPGLDVHYGIACDGCNMIPIRGIRFKCTACPDYDLCESCEAKNIHDPDHPLLKLKVRVGEHQEPSRCATARLGHGARGQQRGHCRGFGRRGCHAKPGQDEQKGSQLQAKFIRDLSIPDRSPVVAGQVVIKEWEFLNNGSLQWPKGSKLIFLRGDRELLSEQEEFPVPIAAPGEKVTVAVPLTINKGVIGRRQAYFCIADADRNPFSDRFWIDVDVVTKEQDIKASVKPQSKQDQKKPTVPPQDKKDQEKPKSGAEHRYQAQLGMLGRMGFDNEDLNISLLDQYGGDVEKVAVSLLEIHQYN